MKTITISLLVAALIGAAAPATAADLPVTAATAKPTAPATNGTTIGLEASPEFFADPANVKYGQINDFYIKGTVTQTVAPGFTVAGSLQAVDKLSNSPATFQGLFEGSAAYKFKLDALSLSIGAGLGYTWGNTGYAGGAAVGNGTDPFLYYFATAGLDYKLDSNWTWNIVNARYRNAFGVTWITPKISTGVTYNIDSSNAVYANIGYGWKDSGTGLKPDKLNVAVGYKYSF
jgi:hypothetical protein